VQVILVITGLGATPVDARPVEQEPVETKPEEPKPVAQQVAEILHPAIPASVIRPAQPKPSPQVELAGAPANLDLPAFLRKRARG
jgi:hypothetical protein